MKLQGHIALITGGSRGIGRATALAFAGAAFRAWRLGGVSARGLAGAVMRSLEVEVY